MLFLHLLRWSVFLFALFINELKYIDFLKIVIVIQLQLYAFSPHPSTPPQLNPPPSPTSTLSLDFVHVSFIAVPVKIHWLLKVNLSYTLGYDILSFLFIAGFSLLMFYGECLYLCSWGMSICNFFLIMFSLGFNISVMLAS